MKGTGDEGEEAEEEAGETSGLEPDMIKTTPTVSEDPREEVTEAKQGEVTTITTRCKHPR